MSKILVLTVSLLAALAVGCISQPEESKTTTNSGAQAPSEAAASVLGAYESVRSGLATDREPDASDYVALASAARQATAEYDGAAGASLSRLATAADTAAAESGTGLPAARMQFGRVSEPFIDFLSSRPELAEGRFVFECPMAKGYPKWVQNSQAVSNPYMGSAMASCGSAGRWEP